MRMLTTLLTCAAVLGLALPHAARAAAKYHLTPLTIINKQGYFQTAALTDAGLALGTFYPRHTQGTLSLIGNTGGGYAADFCGTKGALDGTLPAAVNPGATSQYIVGACLPVGANFAAQSFIYDGVAGTTTLIAVPNMLATMATGVTAGGLVVGTTLDNGTGRSHGFYRIGSTYTKFDPPGSTATRVNGISTANTQYGAYVTNGVEHGMLYDQFGATTTLDYPGSTITVVTGVNGQGQAVGTFVDSTGHLHAFAYYNGSYTKFQPQGEIQAASPSINENGDVAGTYLSQLNGANITYGYVWQPTTGKLITFTSPVGGTSLTVYAINNTHAQVTGFYVVNTHYLAYIGNCLGTSCF